MTDAATIPSTQCTLGVDIPGYTRAQFASGHEIYVLDHRVAQQPAGVAWYERWEEYFIKPLMHLVKPGDVVYDIGAEQGEFSALVGSVVGGGNVHLFEPTPEYWRNMRHVWTANNLAAPVCFPGFVAHQSDPGWQQHVSHGWPIVAAGSVWTDARFGHYGTRSPNAPAVSIDDYVEAGGTPPDVVIMDVEGAEALVVIGMRKVLKKYRPRVFVSLHLHCGEPGDRVQCDYSAPPLPCLRGFFSSCESVPPCVLGRSCQQEHVFRFFALAGYQGKFLGEDHEAHWVFCHRRRGFGAIR